MAFSLGLFLSPTRQVTLNVQNKSDREIKLIKIKTAKASDTEFLENVKSGELKTVKLNVRGENGIVVVAELDDGTILSLGEAKYVQNGYVVSIPISNQKVGWKLERGIADGYIT